MAKQAKQTTDVHLKANLLSFILYPLSFLPLAFSLHPALVLIAGMLLVSIAPAQALPSPEDKPEEVLRAEIITGARSPIDGKPLTASEYAQLQAELQIPAPSRPELGRSIEKNLNLLRLRKFLKTFFPFLPVP